MSVSEIVNSLETERRRAFSTLYVRPEHKLERWTRLRETDPPSIRHNAVKKRACLYMRRIHKHSKELFTLCAFTIPWSTLGEIRAMDDALKIIEWWETVPHPRLNSRELPHKQNNPEK